MHGSRKGGLQLRKDFLNAIDHADDVRSGLALNIQDDRWPLIRPSCLPHVFSRVPGHCHVRQSHRRAVAIRNDDGIVSRARKKLVIGANRKRLVLSIEGAFGLIDVGVTQRSAQIFQAEPVRSQCRRVGLNANGRPLAPADTDQPNSG